MRSARNAAASAASCRQHGDRPPPSCRPISAVLRDLPSGLLDQWCFRSRRCTAGGRRPADQRREEPLSWPCRRQSGAAPCRR
eukprot:1220250-Prymnesium_polylepis.1